MKKLSLIIILFISFSMHSLLGANNFIAKIELYQGKVYYALKNSKALKQVKIGQKLVDNTVITTSKKSTVTLKLKNASLIEVKENSKLVLNKELLDKSSVSLLKGSTKFKIQKILKQDAEFNVFTPTAVVGVRGTEYELGVAPDGSLAVNMNDGNVIVNNDSKEVALNKNESATTSLENDAITKDQTPQDINAINNQKQDEMKKNPIDKLNVINMKFDVTLNQQQDLINKLDNVKGTTNKNVGDDINQGLFNQAKTEGLYTVANDIKNSNPQEKLVKTVYNKINALYNRLNRLNKMMDEKFNRLDKIYQSKETELQKKLDDKEKMFDEKFKNLYEGSNK